MPQLFKVLLLPFLLVLLARQGAVAQDMKPFEGFGQFAWGTSIEEVRGQAEGSFDFLSAINPDYWNSTDVAAYTGFSMGPLPKVMRFLKKNAETVDYYFVQNELCMVIQTPNMHSMFRPSRLVRQIETVYDKPEWRSFSRAHTFPHSFGLVSSETEIPITITYENSEGRVRMCVKGWPPNDLKQVYRVVYFSKTRSTNHAKLLEDWKNAEIARLAAEKKKREAEAAKRKQEAAAAKAAQN